MTADVAGKTVIVVPHFNHHEQFAPLVPMLAATGLDLLVVDDGSEENSVAALRQLLGQLPGATLVQRSENGGKGAAVMTGLRAAPPGRAPGSRPGPPFT